MKIFQLTCRKTALMNACILEKESVIWFLLTNGARVDMQNDYGYTALMWCCIYGRVCKPFSSLSLSLSLFCGVSSDLLAYLLLESGRAAAAGGGCVAGPVSS